MTNWKKNLVFVWLSQFMSIMGFSFAMPFAPYYIQELGVTDPLKLKLWIAAFTASAPLSLAVCAPLWVGWRTVTADASCCCEPTLVPPFSWR